MPRPPRKQKLPCGANPKPSNRSGIAGRVFGVPLLIQPQKLSVILQAIGPRLGLPPGEFEIEGLGVPVVARVTQGPLDEGHDPDEMDDAARSQKPYLVTPEGVAIIGVSGTLVKKASWLDAASGMQSYESIRADFQDAVRDPRILGILLDVDSPGGEVGGLFDLVDGLVGPAELVAQKDHVGADARGVTERVVVLRVQG